jgi:hypothetical protein
MRLQFGRDLRQLVARMEFRFLNQEEIANSELSDFGKMMQEHEYGYAFMVNELMIIAYSGDK